MKTLAKIVGIGALALALWFLIVWGVMALLSQSAHAHEPGMNELSPPPLMAHGVTQCGEVIALWILKVDADGQVRAYRTDVFHHPDDPSEYNAFLRWVGRTPKDQTDMFELPCDKK